MKFLIWTLCIVPAAFLMVLIENAGGSSMGALPKTLIAGGAFALAGLTEEVFLEDFAHIEIFKRVAQLLEKRKNETISANERRWLDR